MALHIRQFKSSEYITYFSMLLFSLAIYSIFYALEISSTTLETSLIFYKLQYVGIVMIPVLLFLFSISYTREKQWIKPARIAAIFVVPVITLVLVFTSEKHHLFHEVAYINTVGPFFGLYFEPGIYYWFNQFYSIILIMFSIALFFKMWLYNKSFFGMHLVILIICSLIPFSVYLLYLAGFFPKAIDPVPFAFILSAMLIYIGLFRYRLLDITPLARSLLFENIPSGVIVLDGKERIVDINQFAEKYLALSAKDIGKPASEVLGYWSELLDIEYNNKEMNKIELKKSLADATFWFAVNVSPLYSKRGNINGRMIVLDNITYRKLAEEIQSTQHTLSINMGTCSGIISTLNSLMEDLVKIEAIDSGGIYLVDDNGNLDLIVHNGLSQKFIEQCRHYDNDSFNAKLVRDGRLVYKKYYDILSDVTNDILSEVFLSEGLRSMTAIPIYFEGNPIASMNLSSHTYNELPEQTRNGLESIASFTGEYITRAKIQDILSRQKTDLECLFNSMNDLLFVLDESGNIISTNESARLKLGYNEDEFTSMKAIDVHPKERMDEIISIHNEMLEGKIDFCSIPLLSKDGTCIPAETKFTVGKWEGKKALFGISRDVSEHQKFEMEIIEAKNKAEEANRAKSEFLANMSHELRTPLNSIIGFSQLLNSNPSGNLDEKETNYSYNIMTSGEHLLELINDILDISKIESGEMELEYERFNLPIFFFEVEGIIKQLADEKNIQICNQTRSKSIEVYADRLKMKQILYNLLSNSLKFTPENGCI
ncbi:PAS domain S-box protein [Methanococcoides seepicolus]|uniref:histidine kinase n=2 Tax=Methanococcoides seepicolus TaxID=2828780 RepID=A0A9E4ZJB6_9EURY|nr:PAS domain S-box protein [Methanococcoides seepicolus]